jgi:hypothetical protein
LAEGEQSRALWSFSGDGVGLVKMHHLICLLDEAVAAVFKILDLPAKAGEGASFLKNLPRFSTPRETDRTEL